jgi:hypothetical protein
MTDAKSATWDEITEVTRRRPEPSVRLERRGDGRLWLLGDSPVAVRPVRCFPWSAPTEHVSLRDADDTEHAYVHDADELAPDSRAALVAALEDAGLVLEIVGVDAVEEDQEIRCYHVRTRQGPRRFQTRLETWPRPVPGGGLLIEDVAGDLFWIRELSDLDAQSKKHLWAYVD